MVNQSNGKKVHSQTKTENLDNSRPGLAEVINAASAVKTGDGAQVAYEALLTERHRTSYEALEKILSGPAFKELSVLLDARAKQLIDRKAEAHEKIAADGFRQAKWAFGFFVLLMIAAFGFLLAVVYLLRDQKDLLIPVVSAVVSMVTGATGVFVAGRGLLFRGGN